MRAPVLAVALVLVAVAPVAGHVALDPERAEEALRAVATNHAAAREGHGEASLDALFKLGEAAARLIEMLNQDLAAHGETSLFDQMLVKRLQAYGVRVTFSETAKRYAYDHAAFEEYLKRAPRGPRAPDARFKLIARDFHATLGPDPAVLVNADMSALLRAIATEERFLRDYAGHEKTDQVRFFLAVDFYRASRNTADAARAARYAERARRELAVVVARSPETFEARAAEALLERLNSAGR
jgi:hypothetical protein